jgi:Rha family phage regulatory protein
MNEINIVIENNQVLVTSKEVARDFNKEHKHVLRDIDSFKKDVSNFGLMFQETKLPDSYGRNQRVYLMNRDGFSLLAMGFTGKDALEWKVKYINKFNELEKLQANTNLGYIVQLQSNVLEMRKEIRQLQKKADVNKELPVAQEALESRLYTTEEIASEMNISSARALNNILREAGVQYMQKKHWKLYAKYKNKGLKDMSSLARSQMWTAKGKQFVQELLEEMYRSE